jgi:tetratricopeptide (TPR) repeat protein
MRLRLTVFAVFLAIVLAPRNSFCDIYEYADESGKVVYYKYAKRGGSVVFTDSLNAIPEEYRRNAKIVRKAAPGIKGGAGGKRLPESPPAPVASREPLELPNPEAPAPREAESDDFPSSTAIAVSASLVIGMVLAGWLIANKKRRPSERGVPTRAREPQQRDAVDVRARIQERLAGKDYRGAAELCVSVGKHQEAANLFHQAGDYAAAARIHESQGNLEKAAACHREAGSFAKAAEIFLGLKNYRVAAELFEKGGRRDRAVDVYIKAGLLPEAASLLEQAGDFTRAAECHLKSGNLEEARACLEKGGDAAKGNALLGRYYYEKGLLGEAAACAEKAGDLLQAAEMFQEAGYLSKAGDLFRQGGFPDEAGEAYLRANEPAKAAEVYEEAGKYLQAARAREALGGGPDRVAELFEKGGDFYSAARHYVKLGQLDRALNALQQVEAASDDFRRASLTVGMIFLKKGLTSLAFEKFSKIIDRQPINKSNLDPYYFLALCCEASGDRAKAKSIFENILIEDYNFRDVKKRLERSASR